MASFQKTLNLDTLTVKTIYTRGENNSNLPPYGVLTSDGNGGTLWTSTFVGDGTLVGNVTAVALSTNRNYDIGSGQFTASTLVGDGTSITNVTAVALSTNRNYDIGSGQFTASTFVGDGSQLTGVILSELLPNIDYDIGSGEFTAAAFNGPATYAITASNLATANSYTVSGLQIGQGTENPQPHIFATYGDSYFNGGVYMNTNVWHGDTEYNSRLYYGDLPGSQNTVFGSPQGYEWKNIVGETIKPLMSLDISGVLRVSSLQVSSFVSNTTVQNIVTGGIIAQNVSTNTLYAYTGTISSLITSSIEGYSLQMNIGSISSLETSTLYAREASLSSLGVSTFVTRDGSISTLHVESFSSLAGSISTLTVSSMTADLASISTLGVRSLSTANGSISTLTVSSMTADLASISSLGVRSLSTANGSISTLTVSSMTADLASISSLGVRSLSTANGSISTLVASTIAALSMNLGVGSISSLGVSTLTTVNGSISSLGISTAAIVNGSISSLRISTAFLVNGSVSSLAVSSLTVATGSVSTLAVSSLTVATGSVSTLTVATGSISTLTVAIGSVSTLAVSSITAVAGSISTLAVSSLSTVNASVSTLAVSSMVVARGSISTLAVSTITAVAGSISTLAVSSLSTVNASISTLATFSLSTVNGSVSTLAASTMAVVNGSVSSLRVSSTTVVAGSISTLAVSSLSTVNASISTLNVGAATASNLTVATELCSSLIVSSLTGNIGTFLTTLNSPVIYGSTLSGVQLYNYTTTVFAGTVLGSIDGLGTAARFRSPLGITSDTNGNYYVTDTLNKKIRKIDSSGNVTTIAGGGANGITSGIADGTGTAALFTYPTGIVADTSGNLYVTESTNARICKIVLSTKSVTTIPNLILDSVPYGITIDTSGNLYFVQPFNNLIRKIDTSGTLSNVAGGGINGYINANGTNAKFWKPIGISFNNGNLYVADTENNVIRRIDSSGNVTTVAGNQLSGSTNGSGTNAQFNRPHGVQSDTNGNLYIADTYNNIIRKITSTGIVTTVSGTNTNLNIPNSLTVDISGNVYITDTVNNSIDRILVSPDSIPSITINNALGVNCNAPAYTLDVNGTIHASGSIYGDSMTATLPNIFITTTLAGSTEGSTDGTGTAALFKFPSGICTDISGNLYIADTLNNKIRKVTPAGIVTTVVGGGATGDTLGSADGTGTSALFKFPLGICADISGNLYIADTLNDKIRKVTPAGIVTTIVGGGATGDTPGIVDGTGTSALFNEPTNIAIDISNNLYITDYNNHKIRKVTPAGVVTTTVGGGATGYLSGVDDGTGTAALFSYPYGITIDTTNTIYVTTYNGNTVRKIISETIVTTYAGNVSGNRDGSASIARFYAPTGIISDTSNTLYITDLGNNRIRMITSDGNVMTIAGNTLGTIDGIGTAALFHTPSGITIDTSGNLYTVETGGHRIRKIVRASPFISITGNLGINSNIPAYTLDVNGTIRASGDIIAFSDRRIKTNIVSIDSALEKVNSLRGVYYTLGSMSTMSESNLTRHVGVIAQEIEQVLPEVVYTDSTESKMKSVAYGNIVAVLIESIKELTGRLAPLESLSTQIGTLKRI